MIEMKYLLFILIVFLINFFKDHLKLYNSMSVFEHNPKQISDK